MNRFEQGFSLFELLIVLTIVGVMAALGLNVSVFMADPLQTAEDVLVRQISAGRSRAVLLRRPVTLVVEEQCCYMITDGQPGGEKMTLPDTVRVVSVNHISPDAKQTHLVFHPFGTVRESVLHLEYRSASGKWRQRTVYVPGVGAPLLLDGHQNLDQIMKEIL